MSGYPIAVTLGLRWQVKRDMARLGIPVTTAPGVFESVITCYPQSEHQRQAFARYCRWLKDNFS